MTLINHKREKRNFVRNSAIIFQETETDESCLFSKSKCSLGVFIETNKSKVELKLQHKTIPGLANFKN